MGVRRCTLVIGVHVVDVETVDFSTTSTVLCENIAVSVHVGNEG